MTRCTCSPPDSRAPARPTVRRSATRSPRTRCPRTSLATARSSSTRRARTSTPSRSSCRSRTEWSCRSTPSSSQRLRRSTRGSSNPMTQAPVIDDPGTRESTGPARWARVPWVRIGIVLAVIAAAVVAAYVRSGSTVVVTQAVVTGILIGGVYGLVAMGLTLIFGVLDIVNFAHGSFLAVALFLSYYLVAGAGMHPYLALLVVPPSMVILGPVVQ